MSKDFYGFYCDIESNRLLNDAECVMFIPSTTSITTTSRTTTSRTTTSRTTTSIVNNPVFKLIERAIIKQTNQKTTTTILRQESHLLRQESHLLRQESHLLRQETPKPKIVKQDLIKNFTQNFMRITFCIFLTIIFMKPII